MRRPAYDRAAQAIGLVHFGIGAFHRAHQAWYTDRAMQAGDRDWAIAGVSLRSAGVAEQMNPQDGLFTLTERSDGEPAIALIGSVRKVLVGAADHAAIVTRIAAPSTHVVSFTVTEKGYCRRPDGALDHAVASDGSFYPLLATAMRQRMDEGRGGLSLVSCDNLAGNGAQLHRLFAEYLDRADPPLRDWFERECACPSTMVDRIVPATTEADRQAIAEAIGMDDRAAVVTEPFSQWVIEDRFATSRPRWEAAGAEIVADIAAYETAKLRMLNGAHSAIAYLGLGRGHAFVHEAMADPAIRATVERLMAREALPSLAPAPGQDLARYADALLARFDNPALHHALRQIAMDGSQKIPQRWLETLAHHAARGVECPAILTALAAWLRHVRGDNGPVDDPLSEALRQAWKQAGAAGIVDAVFGAGGPVPSAWHPTAADRARIVALL